MLTGANSGVMSLDYDSEVSAFYNMRIYANKEKSNFQAKLFVSQLKCKLLL